MLTIEEINQKQQLKQQLENELETAKSKLNEQLLDYLQQLVNMPLYRGYDLDLNYDYDHDSYKIICTIRFKVYKEREIEWGRKYDSGSDIDLYIYKDHLTVNHSSCWHYSRDEKALVQRDILLGKIWEHEQDILELVNSIINGKSVKDLFEINCDLQRHDSECKAIKEDKKRKEIINLLNSGGPLYLIKSTDEKNMRYMEIYKIKKTTEKIITLNRYYADIDRAIYKDTRFDKDDTIRAIIYERYHLLTEQQFNELKENNHEL